MYNIFTPINRSIPVTALALILFAGAAQAQTTAFAYQGQLTDGGSPANGTYDMQFKLFDTDTVGTGMQQGSTITNTSVAVTNGAFTVMLDFGDSVFTGAQRFLEVGIRAAGDTNPYTVLAPRQTISPTPYAIRSLVASAADGMSGACVNCVTSDQIQSVQGSQVSGAIPVASVPGGSSNYIQNTTAQQVGTFNISGNGNLGGNLTAAGVIRTNTQYNIGNNRVLSVPGLSNTFVGISAGQSNTTGSTNSFFGQLAGMSNTTGHSNAFFGFGAGQSNTIGGSNAFYGNNSGGLNTTGSSNSFFGPGSGFNNTTGFANSFFGIGSGQANTEGYKNSFFGDFAGALNTIGTENAFFGTSSGLSNTTGTFNTFLGAAAGYNNTSGNNNISIGVSAGASNTAESNNTFIGANSNGAEGINNATAIGANAQVTQSNSLVLGSINGVNGAKAHTNVGIGTTAPAERLHVQGGNIYIGAAGQGIILKSPDGALCRLLTIDNAGNLVITPTTCP